MPQPPGTVGILSADMTRYAWFSQSILALQCQLPPGSQILWCQGLWIGAAVNRLIRQMTGEWLCILADDHVFQPDLVSRMLAHEVDVVAPLCCLRRLPFRPSLFHEKGMDYQGYTWHELRGKSGLLPVDAMGGPGVVIRSHVLDAMGDPWFENHPLQREAPYEDLYFFSKVRQAGFQPYCDLETPIGHITSTALYPHRDSQQQWGVRLWNEADIALLDPGEM